MAKIVVHRTIPNIVLKKRKLLDKALKSPLIPERDAHFWVEGQKEAYKKAAIATIRKLHVLNNEPLMKALTDIRRYEEYLMRENGLTLEDINGK